MVLGLGIDLVETARIAQGLERTPGLLDRVWTEAEVAFCAPRADRIQALAARFAAKEACLKALGTGWSEGLAFDQVEVVREGNTPPTLRLTGRAAERAAAMGVVRIHLSLTHQPGVAGAVGVLEGPDGT